MRFRITDEMGNKSTEVDGNDVDRTLRDWFAADPEIYSAIDSLQCKLNRGVYTGEEEAYLAIRLEMV